jgi:hypothetical protein
MPRIQSGYTPIELLRGLPCLALVYQAGAATAPDGTPKDVISVSWMMKTDGLQSTDMPLD